ncbi:MAG: hypothetical protein NTW87_01775 [Planctomycetota bacterium]|nr:hypothetical protein [Planctomycetota bacterium]
MPTAKARKKKPAPAYRFKGRRVYTQEQLESFDSRLPNESAWAHELKRRAAAKVAKPGS